LHEAQKHAIKGNGMILCRLTATQIALRGRGGCSHTRRVSVVGAGEKAETQKFSAALLVPPKCALHAAEQLPRLLRVFLDQHNDNPSLPRPSSTSSVNTACICYSQ
jgi:hypothetical protein